MSHAFYMTQPFTFLPSLTLCRPDGHLIKYPLFPDVLNALNVQPLNIRVLVLRLCPAWQWPCACGRLAFLCPMWQLPAVAQWHH